MASRIYKPLQTRQFNQSNKMVRQQQQSPQTADRGKNLGSQLFEDKEFPARWESLSEMCDAVAWLRPHELREKPQLFVDGSSRFDINQGYLGDCWFLASCAAVAELPQLIKKIIPEGQVLYGPGYDGSLRFRFWNLGSWEDVKIDDRLPVNEMGTPVYARCNNKDEFWMPLLEKAFARYYGSYNSIEGGWVSEGLPKLVGYSLEPLPFASWAVDMTFQKMKDGLDNGGMIVIGTGMGGPGIPGSHAYTVTSTFHLPTDKNKGEELRLVRVRNPWGGRVEWTGAWKDKDECWGKLSNEIKNLLEYKPSADGEYWMDIADFMNWFTDGVVMKEMPQNYEDMKIVQEIKSHWSAENSGGPPVNVKEFAKNPQYLLMAVGNENTIPEATEERRKGNADEVEVYVELIQEKSRKDFGDAEIGFFIFEVVNAEKSLTADELLEAHATAGANIYHTVIARSRVLLQPGRRYVVVLATNPPGYSGKFMLRVYSRHPRILLRELPKADDTEESNTLE